MKGNKNIDLCVATYGDTKDLDYDLVVIPWGATEPHNLHLPYLTDSILIIDCAYNIMNSANEKAGALKVEPPAKISTANILLTNPRELKGTRRILKGNENSRIC